VPVPWADGEQLFQRHAPVLWISSGPIGVVPDGRFSQRRAGFSPRQRSDVGRRQPPFPPCWRDGTRPRVIVVLHKLREATATCGVPCLTQPMILRAWQGANSGRLRPNSPSSLARYDLGRRSAASHCLISPPMWAVCYVCVAPIAAVWLVAASGAVPHISTATLGWPPDTHRCSRDS
jgi:hypothetical protein